MKTTVSPIAQRIALKLDGGIPLEALILNRYWQLPGTRREEWLRGLLVRGFEGECGALRTLQREEQSATKVLPSEAIAIEQPSAPTTSGPTPMPCNSEKVVCFAALRKVIG
jgi:hypothetical protein